ncbi:MAG TPA: LUD domain-containing protein [Flavisolibacter sp.]|nr:LUD domain-containing protein [Flavisolibacter sp.]
MNSREKILEAIRKNKPTDFALPAMERFKDQQDDTMDRFINVLAGIGGLCTLVEDQEPINAWMMQKKGEGVCVNAINELSGYNLDKYLNADANVIEGIHSFIVKGTVAVGENGAVWIPEKNMGNRLLPFLCQQLVIVVEEKDIVSNMHEAYEKITIDEDGYGLFIAGPSKTADIEQSLVIGAHGPLSLQVFVIKNKN